MITSPSHIIQQIQIQWFRNKLTNWYTPPLLFTLFTDEKYKK